jgi:hypothetical protein
VLFGDAAVRAASNAQQWYVSISRGRKSIQVFTPNKDQLRQAILRSGNRELALDLAPDRQRGRGVEPSGSETHLFPYQQLVTASLIQESQTETLRLVFATHEVQLGGRNLREMLHALQDFSVKWVRLVPERYQSTIGIESGIVTSIRIKETS